MAHGRAWRKPARHPNLLTHNLPEHCMTLLAAFTVLIEKMALVPDRLKGVQTSHCARLPVFTKRARPAQCSHPKSQGAALSRLRTW